MASSRRALWNQRWRVGSHGRLLPSAFLLSLEAVLPRRGLGLDVAGGNGIHAVWLAQRGLSVTLIDFSEVALAQARDRAARAKLDLMALELDLEVSPLPSSVFDVILCFHYLNRSMLSTLAANVAPGGLLVVEHPTVRNTERHARPARSLLLEEGELPGLIPGFGVLSYKEEWNESGRHEARLLARRFMS